jgi:hypothetical protein
MHWTLQEDLWIAMSARHSKVSVAEYRVTYRTGAQAMDFEMAFAHSSNNSETCIELLRKRNQSQHYFFVTK